MIRAYPKPVLPLQHRIQDAVELAGERQRGLRQVPAVRTPNTPWSPGPRRRRWPRCGRAARRCARSRRRQPRQADVGDERSRAGDEPAVLEPRDVLAHVPSHRPAPRAGPPRAGPPTRCSRSRCTGTDSLTKPRGSAPRWRRDLSSSSAAAMIMPGVQKPHCSACAELKACCSGCSSPASPRIPSIVTIDARRPDTPAAGRIHRPAVEQDRAGTADALFASQVHSGAAEAVTEHVGERDPGFDRARAWQPLSVKPIRTSSATGPTPSWPGPPPPSAPAGRAFSLSAAEIGGHRIGASRAPGHLRARRPRHRPRRHRRIRGPAGQPRRHDIGWAGLPRPLRQAGRD